MFVFVGEGYREAGLSFDLQDAAWSSKQTWIYLLQSKSFWCKYRKVPLFKQLVRSSILVPNRYFPWN